MATIFMSVLNELMALESLIYVFRNQMELVKIKLSLTLKHKDGHRDYSFGNIDKVFKSELIGEIECGDMILLEHYNNIHPGNCLYIEGEVDSLGTLVDLGKNMDNCCHFMMPKGNDVAYFLIKNYPMFRFNLYRNEFISEKIFGKNNASIVNNMTGKIRSGNGILAMLSTYSR